ncbi:MAG TPA: DUF6265 family protein [Saprospiraceae bacterium]|nr:DUF6265 family protein [Saprospiraceae bacterium]HMP25870.1 DUF6265 family protein [Saprospiraceae bacterium]
MKLSRLFQANQHKLQEKPSPQTWRRLERRLDDHRRHRRISLWQQAAGIAALLALGAFVTLLMLFIDPQAKRFAANYTPEDFDITVQDNSAEQILEFLRNYRERLISPIAEGDISKRITLTGAADRIIDSRLEVSLDDFQWLQGTWQHEVNGQTLLEQWQSRKSARTIEGSVFLVRDSGDTVLVDQMRIRQAQGKIFFEALMETNKPLVVYTLKHFFADRIVFENKSMAFPQQVVFDIKSPQVYSLVFQNENLLEVNNAQADYLARRNTIIPQRIVRVLERVRG